MHMVYRIKRKKFMKVVFSLLDKQWAANIIGQKKFRQLMFRWQMSSGVKCLGGRYHWAANVREANVFGGQMSLGGRCLGGRCHWTANVRAANVSGRQMSGRQMSLGGKCHWTAKVWAANVSGR